MMALYYSVIWSADVQYLIYLTRKNRYYASPNIRSPFQNKSDTGQAADQTPVLLFPPKIWDYVSLTIMRSNYKAVHHAQLKKE